MFSLPARFAPPASARNSRRRLNHMTMTLASTASTSSAMIAVIQKPGPCPRWFFNIRRSTKCPMMRDSTMTKVLMTPCISASVIMSPLATCETSCASTASTSFFCIFRKRPVLTATSARLRRAPVAKAFMSGAS